jgi:tetratricopeptide (TPR) repeat protein
VGAAAVALYARAVGFGWVFDDPLEIVGNEFVRSLAYLPKWFTTTAWAGSGMETYLYRPLPLATYALNYQLTGLEPWSYHLVNVLLHAGVSLLVFRLGFLWGLPVAATGMGALLFAVHPAHVEVVAAVFGRKDLLAALFVLLMALGHRWALQSGGWRRALPVASFALALLSKEVGAAGLPLVAAQDLLLGDRRRTLAGNRAPSLYIAYLGVLLLYVLARNRVTGTAGVPDTSPFDNPLVGVSVAIRLATALVVIGKGILLQAAPLTLSPDYSYNAIPLVESLLDVRLLAALSALGVGGALLAPALLRRRRRAATGAERPAPELLAIAWYGIALLPASNLLVPVGTIFGERLLYLPGVAFFLVVGVGLHRAAHRLPRAIPAGAALLVVALGAQTVRYSSAWSDDVSLFRWAVANVPASTKVHHKLGEELLRRGDLGGAIRSLDRALEIAPANEFAALTRSMAASRIAERYLPPAAGRGGADEAARDPDVLYVLGQISRERGEAGRAVGFWEEALRLDPGHPESLADLAIVRVLAGDTVTAADYLESAVRRRPSLTTAWLNLAQLRLARGETPLAREALRRFLETAGSRFPEQTRWARATLEGLTGR